MTFNPDLHHRQSIRLKEYDYTRGGAYFITICTWQREPLFGEIINDEMLPNDTGHIIKTVWDELPEHYSNVTLDAFVLMPNHMHGIMILDDTNVGAGFKPAQINTDDQTKNRASLKPAPTVHNLSEIIRGFKTFSSRKINQLRCSPSVPVWQRNYYEHIIRSNDSLEKIREYIHNNPTQWAMDKENLEKCAKGNF